MRGRDWVGKTLPLLALTTLFLLGIIWGAHRHRRPRPLRPRMVVAFLDVGAGDCTLIRSPDGHAALIDAGPAAAGPTVAQTLRRQGIQSLDLLVLASPSAGSIGGVPGLLDGGITVAQVWDNAVADTGDARRDALEALREHSAAILTAHQGIKSPLGALGVRLSVLWPPARGPRAWADALVCRADYGETGLVLAGPVSGVAENYLVAGVGEALSCDVLQVADGGADSATSPELLRRAMPSVAVISGAASVPPGLGTLHRLQAAGAAVWRTDAQGAITVFADGRGPPVVTAAHM